MTMKPVLFMILNPEKYITPHGMIEIWVQYFKWTLPEIRRKK